MLIIDYVTRYPEDLCEQTERKDERSTRRSTTKCTIDACETGRVLQKNARELNQQEGNKVLLLLPNSNKKFLANCKDHI